MHELSLCQGIIGQVERIAAEHGAETVERILLHIGPLSGVEPMLLQDAFPIAAADSRAAHARLEIEPQPIRVRCRLCGAESDATPNRLLCAQCGAWQTEVVSGDEMLLMSVELSIDADTRDKIRDTS